MSWVSLQNITLATTASSVTFSNIPSGFRDLYLVTSSNTSTGSKNLLIRLNNDSTSGIYTTVLMAGDGSSAASGVVTDNKLQLDSRAYGSTTLTHIHHVQIMDYSMTDRHKALLVRGSMGSVGVDAFAARYASTNAVTSMTLFYDAASIAAGGTFALYGISG